ncbi:MAG: DNA-binding protein [Deltaproteobacteria bacterium RIFOXYD12_FULL_57_12]|nr:MAG: DNA-binding protein [Deltaproteobacteria bacterium RIFOXYD12_FULL_57_12]
MEYRAGEVGRVFAVRFDEGDDFLGGLYELVRRENIRHAWFHVLGGLRQAGVVTGPEKPVMPPVPVWREMDGAREVLGTGSVFWDGDEPRVHLHAALGEHGDTVTACVRKGTKVYLVLEVYLIEIVGLAAGRPWYETGGFYRLSFPDDGG